MNKNEKILKEIARRGFELKMVIQKCEEEMSQGSLEIIKAREKISKARANKFKAQKQMMELF